MTEDRPPLLTKPAGVAVQLIGAVALIVGLALLVAEAIALGVAASLVGVGLLWLGRQTRPRKA